MEKVMNFLRLGRTYSTDLGSLGGDVSMDKRCDGWGDSLNRAWNRPRVCPQAGTSMDTLGMRTSAHPHKLGLVSHLLEGLCDLVEGLGGMGAWGAVGGRGTGSRHEGCG